jgi:hypothetical protein
LLGIAAPYPILPVLTGSLASTLAIILPTGSSSWRTSQHDGDGSAHADAALPSALIRTRLEN